MEELIFKEKTIKHIYHKGDGRIMVYYKMILSVYLKYFNKYNNYFSITINKSNNLFISAGDRCLFVPERNSVVLRNLWISS